MAFKPCRLAPFFYDVRIGCFQRHDMNIAAYVGFVNSTLKVRSNLT